MQDILNVKDQLKLTIKKEQVTQDEWGIFWAEIDGEMFECVMRDELDDDTSMSEAGYVPTTLTRGDLTPRCIGSEEANDIVFIIYPELYDIWDITLNDNGQHEGALVESYELLDQALYNAQHVYELNMLEPDTENNHIIAVKQGKRRTVKEWVIEKDLAF